MKRPKDRSKVIERIHIRLCPLPGESISRVLGKAVVGCRYLHPSSKTTSGGSYVSGSTVSRS